eukprot:tig00021489_g21694.t1
MPAEIEATAEEKISVRKQVGEARTAHYLQQARENALGLVGDRQALAAARQALDWMRKRQADEALAKLRSLEQGVMQRLRRRSLLALQMEEAVLLKERLSAVRSVRESLPRLCGQFEALGRMLEGDRIRLIAGLNESELMRCVDRLTSAQHCVLNLLLALSRHGQCTEAGRILEQTQLEQEVAWAASIDVKDRLPGVDKRAGRFMKRATTALDFLRAHLLGQAPGTPEQAPAQRPPGAGLARTGSAAFDGYEPLPGTSCPHGVLNAWTKPEDIPSEAYPFVDALSGYSEDVSTAAGLVQTCVQALQKVLLTEGMSRLASAANRDWQVLAGRPRWDKSEKEEAPAAAAAAPSPFEMIRRASLPKQVEPTLSPGRAGLQAPDESGAARALLEDLAKAEAPEPVQLPKEGARVRVRGGKKKGRAAGFNAPTASSLRRVSLAARRRSSAAAARRAPGHDAAAQVLRGTPPHSSSRSASRFAALARALAGGDGGAGPRAGAGQRGPREPRPPAALRLPAAGLAHVGAAAGGLAAVGPDGTLGRRPSEAELEGASPAARQSTSSLRGAGERRARAGSLRRPSAQRALESALARLASGETDVEYEYERGYEEAEWALPEGAEHAGGYEATFEEPGPPPEIESGARAKRELAERRARRRSGTPSPEQSPVPQPLAPTVRPPPLEGGSSVPPSPRSPLLPPRSPLNPWTAPPSASAPPTPPPRSASPLLDLVAALAQAHADPSGAAAEGPPSPLAGASFLVARRVGAGSPVHAHLLAPFRSVSAPPEAEEAGGPGPLRFASGPRPSPRRASGPSGGRPPSAPPLRLPAP